MVEYYIYDVCCCIARSTLTLQAALVLLITTLHIIVIICVFVMLFSREKYDAASVPPQPSRHKQQPIPMPLTEVVPASRRPSAASTITGQRQLEAASAAITEAWDPHVPPTDKPLVKAASRIASQIASEPVIGGVGLQAAKPGVRTTSAVRAAASLPVPPLAPQHTVYANLPLAGDYKPDDTYLIPAPLGKPSAAPEGDYLVPVSSKTKPTANVYESLVPISQKTAPRQSIENIYESLHPIATSAVKVDAPALPVPPETKMTVTENIYEPLHPSSSKTRWKGGNVYQPLRLQHQSQKRSVDIPPPLPPRPPTSQLSSTKIPTGPSQMKANDPPLPEQSTIAIAGSVWPAKINTAPPPPQLPPPPPSEQPLTTPGDGPSAQPTVKFREKLKTVVTRALEEQRRQAELAASTPATQYESLPSNAAEQASLPLVHEKVRGRKVAEALRMIDQNRATSDVPAESAAVPASAVNGSTTAFRPPLQLPLESSTPLPPPPCLLYTSDAADE